jgi:hypothetical protein
VELCWVVVLSELGCLDPQLVGRVVTLVEKVVVRVVNLVPLLVLKGELIVKPATIWISREPFSSINFVCFDAITVLDGEVEVR